MVTWTSADSERLYALLAAAVEHADLGSRTAYKAVQSMKPIIDTKLEKWAVQARKNEGPAK